MLEIDLNFIKYVNNLKLNFTIIFTKADKLSINSQKEKLKRYNDAKNYLQSAVKLMPADPIINDHYGDALWKNGKKIQARYYWNYVLNLKDSEEDLKDNIKNKLILGL